MANKLTSRVLVLATAVAVAGSLWWLLHGYDPGRGSVAGIVAPPVPEPEQHSQAMPGLGEKKPVKARRPVRLAVTESMLGEHTLTDQETVAGASFRAEDYAKSRMQIFFEFQRAVRSWSPGIFDQKTLQRDSLTGEQAYEVYVYLRSCLQSLRSADALEQQTEAMQQYHDRNPEQFSIEDLDNSKRRLRSDLARCEGVGAELDHELELLLADWLTLAAERGYPQAQLAYHQSIRWLLSRQPLTVFRAPQRVREYRARAPGYLRAALRSGHSEAFVEYSLALQEGILLGQDDELAFAYARAADLAAHGSNETATTYLSILENTLPAAQVAAARRQGRALCDTWCL